MIITAAGSRREALHIIRLEAAAHWKYLSNKRGSSALLQKILIPEIYRSGRSHSLYPGPAISPELIRILPDYDYIYQCITMFLEL